MARNGFVLIHGINDSPAGVERLRCRLAPYGPTLAATYLGHAGRPLEEQYTLEMIAYDIAAQIEDHGFSSCHVVGHSFGGAVARRLAELRPDLVATLTEIAAPFRASFFNVAYVLDNLQPDKASHQGRLQHRVLARRHHPEDWKRVAQANIHLVRGMRGRYWNKRVDVLAPSLIISGADDPFGDPRSCISRAKMMRDVRVMLVRGSLHPLSDEQDDLMVAAILRLRSGELPPSGVRLVGHELDERWITSKDLLGGSAFIHTNALRLGKVVRRVRFAMAGAIRNARSLRSIRKPTI